VAAGTGELLQRLQAESATPIADVLWGGGADSLAAYKYYFQPYVCANDAVIDDAFKDADDLWIGESPLPMVIIYNKELLAGTGVTPEDLGEWSGLLDPASRARSPMPPPPSPAPPSPSCAR
jgi:iron(III) transport system substrate-binding protein